MLTPHLYSLIEQASLEGATNSPGLSRASKELGAPVVFPPRGSTIQVRVATDKSDDGLHREQEHSPAKTVQGLGARGWHGKSAQPVRIVGLPHGGNEALHAAKIWFLMPPGLHEMHDELVQLQHRARGSL